jgi:RimJ/RimL family protein N-acetyltransferase
MVLRPLNATDDAPFLRIRSNWNVARMLRMADYPPGAAEVSAWIANADQEWARGTAFRFAVIKDRMVIGCADVDEIRDGWGELGYWLDEPFWGGGLASEAGAAVRDFAFQTLKLEGLKSGHAADNPASGRVLSKLGFTHIGDERRWSKPRSAEIEQWLYRLERPLT